MTNIPLSQSLEKSAQCVRPLELLLQAGTLSQQEKEILQNALSTMGVQADTLQENLQTLVNQYQKFNSAAKQQIWERKLLDLTLRNSLLNYRVGKNAYVVPNQLAGQIEDTLESGQEICLESAALNSLYRAMRNSIEETGANTLYLALGTLVWIGKDKKEHKAPILLMPVELVKLKGKNTYSIRKRDDDTVLNITLLEMLSVDFQLQIEGIQPLPADASGIDVSLVLHHVANAVAEQTGWQVCDDAVLGIFSFTKFVLWNDIHTNESLIAANPLIRSLIEGRLLLPPAAPMADIRQLDAVDMPTSHLIPLDADSSQIEALIDAENGLSFVLSGPPGTGKSQSITNMIANMLYHGKRVLFVAQKKAALDVVKERLDKIGLSTFCLELHSNKVDKRHFLSQLQLAVETTHQKVGNEYETLANQLFIERQKLSAYADALHKKREHGYSLYQCIENMHDASITPIALPPSIFASKENDLLKTLTQRVVDLVGLQSILGIAPAQHPLYGLYPIKQDAKSLSSYMKQDALENQLPQLPLVLEGLKQQIERNAKFISKTTKQYIEGDYKCKKFFQVAKVSDNLLEDIDAFIAASQKWNMHINLLPQWGSYVSQLQALEQIGLGDVIARFEQGESVESLCKALQLGFYQQLARGIVESDPLLKDYSGIKMEQIIKCYTQLHHDFQQLSQKELLSKLSAKRQTVQTNQSCSAELTLLRKRIANKGRGASIRTMIEQMPTTLPLLCPVMLMSPLSVAQYLDAHAEPFDLVIFDEASQMPTSEAVGAIARAKAAIVVGDSKQMPPTSFFSLTQTNEDEADIDDLESILDDCTALSMPMRSLKWHYRSKHEDLITFSNVHYYDSSLMTFPSANHNQPKISLQQVEGYYDAGKSRTNMAEAKAIVAEVVSRMQNEPNRSIGVIAFSLGQSNLIEDLLNEAFVENPTLEQQNATSKEPIFVKNLENVQGDERDVILFSVGYAPDQDGKLLMNFGPLNKAGGEKRLNVAITRARYEMKLFAVLRADQIDEKRTSARGVLDLKQFMKYAAGQDTLQVAKNSSSQTDVIAQQIASWLRQQGYQVETSIGASACKVDIAVATSTHAESYKLGIILDGSHYYNLNTTSDREIVKPAVFNMLGWNLMRVFTLDWFLYPENVKKKIVEKLTHSTVLPLDK